MVGKPKVINLMSLSHSLVEWWVVRQDSRRGRGGAEINKLSWWKQQNISKRAPLPLLPSPTCWCKNLITQTFNASKVIMKIAKRNGQENSKYWQYWKWHPPPFKFSKVIVSAVPIFLLQSSMNRSRLFVINDIHDISNLSSACILILTHGEKKDTFKTWL